MKKSKYGGLTADQHSKVTEKIGAPLMEHGIKAMHQLAGGDPFHFDSFLVKTYQCGQATYRLQDGLIAGSWKDKSFRLKHVVKDKCLGELVATADGIESIQQEQTPEI